MAFSAVADARRFMTNLRTFDIEADCTICKRHLLCFCPDKPGIYLCPDCLAALEADDVQSLEATRYKQFIDDAIIGVRTRDEERIKSAVNAATEVFGSSWRFAR
jgi:hypothetical protein